MDQVNRKLMLTLVSETAGKKEPTAHLHTPDYDLLIAAATATGRQSVDMCPGSLRAEVRSDIAPDPISRGATMFENMTKKIKKQGAEKSLAAYLNRDGSLIRTLGRNSIAAIEKRCLEPDAG